MNRDAGCQLPLLLARLVTTLRENSTDRLQGGRVETSQPISAPITPGEPWININASQEELHMTQVSKKR
eukprot:5314069-Amphidinium_carterae.1